MKYSIIIFVSFLFLLPLAADAQIAVAPGKVIKGETNALYAIGPDGKRYVFPKDNIYFTWFDDFSQVLELTQAEIQAIPLGGSMGVRPGTRLIQFVSELADGTIVVSDANVYAIQDRGGRNKNYLRRIPTAQRAAVLFGENWEELIVPVLETQFSDYVVGDDLDLTPDLSSPDSILDDFAALDPTVNWNEYTSPNQDLTFRYPENWQLTVGVDEETGEIKIIKVRSGSTQWTLKPIDEGITFEDLVEEEELSEMGRSENSNVVAIKEFGAVNGVPIGLILVSNSSLRAFNPDWEINRIIYFKELDNLFMVHNGAMKSEEFELFYKTVKFD